MNKNSLTYPGALRFLFLIAFLIFTEQKKGLPSGFKNVSVEEARGMIEKGDVFVLDVRTPVEFNSSHIEGANPIPVSNASGSNLNPDRLLKARINEVPKTKKVLVYCRTGRRSDAASTILANAGYSQVYNMAGGITSWIDAGYPVVSSQDQENKSP